MRGLVRARWVVGVAVLALGAAACGSDDDGEEPEAQTGGSFSFYIGEPEHLLPTNTNETNGGEVLDALYSGLVDYDVDTSEPKNLMAESITSDDQKVWTIKIKSGWKFHNGEEVTAKSYVDAWNYGANGANAQGNNYFFANIEGYDDINPTDPDGEEGPKKAPEPKGTELSGLKVVDDTTFEVTLTEPFSQFPLTVGYTAFMPMAEECLADVKACEEAPIGNGPFQMDGKWQHNQSVKVKRFEDYQGEKAKADAVEFKIYQDVATAYLDLQAGNLDIMDTLPPEKLAQAKTDFGDRFIERDSSNFTYVGFPLYDKRFENADLRKSFSMAIDRQTIIDKIYNGAYTPAKSVVSPVVAGSRDNPCGDACEYNPEEAKKLFDSAGGYDGTLYLWFNSGAGHDQWMEAVANDLKKNLGIKEVKFKEAQFAEYLADLDAKKADGPFRLGWVMDYPSPQNYLEPIHATGGSSNNTGYSNKQVDDLIKKGNAAPSVDEGIAFYNQAEDQILKDMPIIPMWFGKVQGAHSENVSNVQIDAFTSTRLEEVTVNQ